GGGRGGGREGVCFAAGFQRRGGLRQHGGRNLARFVAAALRFRMTPVAFLRQLGLVADGVSNLVTVRPGFVGGGLFIGRLAFVRRLAGGGLAFAARPWRLGEGQPRERQGGHNEQRWNKTKLHDPPLWVKEHVVVTGGT